MPAACSRSLLLQVSDLGIEHDRRGQRRTGAVQMDDVTDAGSIGAHGVHVDGVEVAGLHEVSERALVVSCGLAIAYGPKIDRVPVRIRSGR